MGVYGGRADVMSVVAPEGPVYQAGTLSGNPVAVAAGVATLKKLDDSAFRTLESLGGMLEDGLGRVIRRSGIKAQIQRSGSAFTIFFTDLEVTDLSSAKQADAARFGRFFNQMLDRGFYLPPAQLETAFISLAHTPEDIESFVVAAKEVFPKL
jgi:glutamate-1-semialdehyde 2,1-aminomutase